MLKNSLLFKQYQWMNKPIISSKQWILNLLGIKYFEFSSMLLWYDLLNYSFWFQEHSKIYASNKLNNSFISWNNFSEFNINIFFQIKLSILWLRNQFLNFFEVIKNRPKQVNSFFFIFKILTPLQYIWLMEYNVLILLIKLKFSNSINFSVYLLKRGFIKLSNKNYLTQWDFISANKPIFIIISLYWFLKIKSNIKTFVYKYINLFYFMMLHKNKNLYKQKEWKVYSTFYIYMFFIYFLEMDYKSLTFILLPFTQTNIYLKYISLIWLNYWNNKIYNWKFII